MKATEAIAKRVSVRKYKFEQIPEEALQAILAAGFAAPVASGRYDTLHISVVQDEKLLNDLSNAVTDMVEKLLGKRMDKNFGAPTMVIVSGTPGAVPGIEYANAACVLENMLIAATDMGIDNIIWGGAAAVAQQESFAERIGIPAGMKPLLCASFGYAETPQEAKKHVIEVNRV